MASKTEPAKLTATFAFAHYSGTLGFTHPWPNWLSSKRHSLIIMTPEGAADPENRRIVHWMMRRMARAGSTWDVCASADGISTGAFLPGVSLAGIQTIVDTTIAA